MDNKTVMEEINRWFVESGEQQRMIDELEQMTLRSQRFLRYCERFWETDLDMRKEYEAFKKELRGEV